MFSLFNKYSTNFGFCRKAAIRFPFNIEREHPHYVLNTEKVRPNPIIWHTAAGDSVFYSHPFNTKFDLFARPARNPISTLFKKDRYPPGGHGASRL